MTLTELEKLARAATPGPWHAFSNRAPDCDPLHLSGVASKSGSVVVEAFIPYEAYGCEPNDAAYIAACHPQTLLALIADLRRCREALEQAHDEIIRHLNKDPKCPQCRLAANTARTALDGCEVGE